MLIASAAAAVLGVALPAARAFAWFTANTLTVVTADPSGPADGETVRVSGRWTNATGATTTTSVYECPVSAVPDVGHHVDPTRCDPRNVDAGVPTKGADHAFSDYLVWDATFSPPAAPTSTVDCRVAHACAVVADGSFTGFFADMAREETDRSSCGGVFTIHRGRQLIKSTDVTGDVVAPGQTITSTFTLPNGEYDPSRDDGRASEVTDCVRLGDTVLAVGAAGSWHEKPGPPVGTGAEPLTFQSTYTVPADTPAGTRVCDRGVVSGIPAGPHEPNEYSRTLCFTVGDGPVLPEAPWPLALPVSALAVGAGWHVWRRRRARQPARLGGT